MARRKRIYEALHPETAHGGDRKSSRQVGDLKQDKPKSERFAKATAKATGASERAVPHDAALDQHAALPGPAAGALGSTTRAERLTACWQALCTRSSGRAAP
jgi:hypothetical protein